MEPVVDNFDIHEAVLLLLPLWLCFSRLCDWVVHVQLCSRLSLAFLSLLIVCV